MQILTPSQRSDTPTSLDSMLQKLISDFVALCEPIEADTIWLMTDARTGANYIECHVRASKLIEHGTIDVPLDPDEQPDYRANRDIVQNHSAFEQMKSDALASRTFSNLVTEFNTAFDKSHPVKVIGGQHRFTAIQEALPKGVDECHGIKVYFSLTPEQRIDVQLISNTNIAVATDLFDRMQETLVGPQLRDWCQMVGLLPQEQDFADRRERGGLLTVRAARTFLVNYYRGRKLKSAEFESVETTPTICRSGVPDPDWEAVKKESPPPWTDTKVIAAGKAFSDLITAQRNAFSGSGQGKASGDYVEKALNYAVLSAWAMTAGLLEDNAVRLQKHFALKDKPGKDPLNAAALAKGRHKTDPENYRGLGYRTDAKERGRLVELFYAQAEQGGGITGPMIDLAIKQYHAKEAHLEALGAKQKIQGNG